MSHDKPGCLEVNNIDMKNGTNLTSQIFFELIVIALYI